MTLKRRAAVLMVSAGPLTMGVHGQVSFTHLAPPVLDRPFFAHGLSADGTTVVGQSGYAHAWAMDEQAAVWNPTPVVLPDLWTIRPYDPRGNAFAASADGSVVVGKARDGFSLHYRAAKWVNGESIPLPMAPGIGYDGTMATAVSADGMITVGTSFQDNVSYHALRWVGTTPTALPGAPGFAFHKATGVSADGSVVAGYSFWHNNNSSHGPGWIWRNGQTTVLPLPAGGYGAWVHGISGDGSTVFGEINLATQGEDFKAALWRNGSLIMLPRPAGLFPQTSARAASFDGSVVVGTSAPNVFGQTAFVWDAINGLRSISDVLSGGGIDLGGFTLVEATGVSADGRTVTGTGQALDGSVSAWIAVIPAPGMAAWIIVAPVLTRRKR